MNGDDAHGLVLIGASNLTRSIPIVVDIARARLGTSLDIFTAYGHGRSFGQPSQVLGRGLPGILECGLWDALAASRTRPWNALVTDIGNDVGYGVPVATIDEWVRTCLERVHDLGAHVIVTGLPLQPLRALPEWRFRLIRTLLFPGSSLTRTNALCAAEDVDDRLRAHADRLGATMVTPDASWYGLDPVHVRRRHLTTAWSTMLSPWSTDAHGIPRSGWLDRLALYLARPAEWTLLGQARRATQPAVRRPEGVRLWRY